MAIDSDSSNDQASTASYIRAEDEIPYLLEEISRLVRSTAQLRATCMKLLKENLRLQSLVEAGANHEDQAGADGDPGPVDQLAGGPFSYG